MPESSQKLEKACKKSPEYEIEIKAIKSYTQTENGFIHIHVVAEHI